MRILVVEDTVIARKLLERTLAKWGYDVDSVSNTEDATELLLTEPIQFVITDWVMPGGDGPSLCRDIRAMKWPYYTYIIIVTSLESDESVIEGLDAGADDFVRKPIQLDELHARIRAGERVLALEKALQERNEELKKLHVNLQEAHNIINRDLQTAAKMQMELLPPRALKYFDVTIDWLFCPSGLVSGDIFNFFRLDETHIGFYTLDVAGHGVSASMMSFTLFRLLTSEMQRGTPLKRPLKEAPYYEIVPPDEVLVALNTQFQTDSRSWLYFTMIYGVIDSKEKTINLCQAGHPSPLFIPKDSPVQFIGEGGFPVGLTDNVEYDTITLNYHPGDRIILYSDGITECTNKNGEMFGPELLHEFIEDTRDFTIKEVSLAMNHRIKEWRGEMEFADDISLLILEII